MPMGPDPLPTPLSMFELVRLILWIGLGLAMWLTGRQIARIVCAAVGLTLGAIAAMRWSGSLGSFTGAPLWVWMMVAAVTGWALGWVLFRVCVAVIGAVMLAVVVPITLLTFEQQTLPYFHPQMAIDTAGDDGGEPLGYFESRFAYRLADKTQEFYTWYGQLPTQRLVTLNMIAAITALCGLMVGLIKPFILASLVSSLMGVVLVWSAVQYALGAVWPHAPGWVVALDPKLAVLQIGLGTVAGVVMQWTLSIHQADNE